MNIADFFPKKQLGQNFLIDDNIRRKIIQACNLSKEDNVLEIGPGLGKMTKDLVILAKDVIAVEKDKRLTLYLCELFKDYKNLKILNQDILKYKIKTKNTKIMGNIPYNITSPIIEHFINQKEKISVIYITIQKEVGERIVASPGTKDYSSFSLFVQYHTIPEIKFLISRGCFKPQPRVDSCFLELSIRDIPAVKVKNEELFFKIIRTCFNQRRKMISNTLKKIITAQKITELSQQTGINPSNRPEDLSLEEFGRIADFVQSC
ncbi:MAG: 16S rRNA (adenine(1518)-N(6)/adenine(1519)-N(6))-dimethyltransferase RsmA [Candidatus Omnitrophota bacterium]|nr:16S rRNA (adenine(1518)-N(6)/adenine(1519)-N(6))-dimethyltransferase RsmA [Candidatus Omnitrophota bacterium]